MNEPQRPIHIDDPERDRVRRSLRRYMEENCIGAPTLQERIIKADAPRHREIPLSTLQRFLTGSHRTSDHHVSLCYDFVKDLAYYGEGKDIALFGAAAFSFFQQPSDTTEDRAERIAMLERDILGSYEAYRPPPQDNPLPLWDSHISNISFSPAGDSPWLEVHEDVFGMSVTKTRYKFEGVAFYAAPLLHIFLRDLFSRQPRLFTLEKTMVSVEDDEYEGFVGRGQDATPRQRMRSSSLVYDFEVKLLPIADEVDTP